MSRDFVVPVKTISKIEHVETFKTSASQKMMLSFVNMLNQSVKGRTISSMKEPSPNVSKVKDMLDRIKSWIVEFPPVQESKRFGNPAFRSWLDKLKENSEDLLKTILPESMHVATIELIPYLTGSFGDWQRLDYGTGHEHSFLCFMLCLTELGVLTSDDALSMVFAVFNSYFKVCRELQKTYNLEPAGSHGVWCLDDHQFLPFLWGSAQLIGHPALLPCAIHEPNVVKEQSEENLYFAAVRFTCEMKSGMLAEHSPMLNDISAVPHWSKVNQGMIKMYTAEVLNKFPVCQHFLFGSIIPSPIAT